MRLSCFGKLPFYPDFIKINGTDFNAVDQWFQKGILLLMQKLGADWAQKFSGASQYNFIFQGDQTRNAIVGAFIPGEDKSGRRFPFSIFFETSKIPLKKLDESLQSMEEAFLKKTGEFFKHEWTGVGLETFNQMFHSWEGQAASSSLLLLDEKQPLNFIWEETLDGAHDSRKYLLVKNLEDTLTPLTRVAAPKSFPGFKIPFNPNAKSPTGLALFWIRLIKAMAGLDSLTVSMVWCTGEERAGHRPYLYFFTGNPTPKSFLTLIDPEHAGDNTFPADLSTIRADKCAELEKKITPKIKGLLDNPETDISTFLSGFR